VRYLMLATVLLLAPVFARADEWEHNYAVNGKPEIVIDANDGDIEVAVASSQQVGVRLVEHGWKINDELKITGTQSGNRIEIRLHRTDKVCFGFCLQNIHLELEVPRQSDLEMHTGDGDLRIDDVNGNLQLETNDGDIRIHDAEGLLHANTHDGDIDVDGRFDVVNLRTGDGNIDAKISASKSPQPGWSLRTGDGDIRLALPDTFAADLDAHTGDGSVKVDFATPVSGSSEESTFRGKINGGGISIELQTGDGDINVEKS
jgi:Putative adhesin